MVSGKTKASSDVEHREAHARSTDGGEADVIVRVEDHSARHQEKSHDGRGGHGHHLLECRLQNERDDGRAACIHPRSSVGFSVD